MNEPLEAFQKIAELAIALGVENIIDLPGCWEHAIDEHWKIAVNGHYDPVNCSTGETVAPFRAIIWFNGWPAGILDPFGGTIAAGEAANEDTFIAALEAAIAKVAA